MKGVKNKRLIIFMPFIGIGGVEKNLYIISNFLSKKIKNLSICTISKDKKKILIKISSLLPQILMFQKN